MYPSRRAGVKHGAAALGTPAVDDTADGRITNERTDYTSISQ